MNIGIELPEEVVSLINIFLQNRYQIYIVGGAVRDLLLKKEVTDWDFTTDAKPDQIVKLFPDSFYDNIFGTVGIPTFQKGKVLEVTTMRKEGVYRDFRHPVEVGWTDRIEEDLKRRDFTINAMALKPISNSVEALAELSIIDSFDGQKDLKDGLVRAVGDPNLRFEEDALRLMRAVRIATQLGFKIEDKTYEAIQTNANLITEIAAERVRDELFLLLKSDNAYDGVLILKETGLLDILFPELKKTFGIVQEGPKHDRVYDIGEHSLLTLKFTPSNDPITRLAALLHDIGKTETYKVEKNGNVTFYNHDIVGAQLAQSIAERLKFSKEQKDKFVRLIRWHLFTVDENQTDAAIRRFIKNIGLENIDSMLALRIGDRLGGGTQTAISWRMENFQERINQVLQKPFSVSDLKVNGHDVMKELNITPSRKVGEILNQLFQEVLENPDHNTREYLLERIRQIGKD